VDEKKDDYEVGYGRPPRRTQFKQGSSGNPRGRPRGSKNLATIVRQVLDARVAVRENGRVRTISKREALFAQLVHEGLGGNLRAIELLSKIPWIQKELVNLGRSRRLTPEAWDQIALLVRGDLNPQSASSAEPGVVARCQPDISEVASRLEQALTVRR
jgi:Family of unknown function (DUF5681)